MKKNFSKRKCFQLIMRTSISWMFIFLLGGITYARSNFAQDILNQKVSIEVQKMDLKSIFLQIEKSTKVRFTYSASSVNNQKISVSAKNERLEEVLKKTLYPLHIDFRVSDDFIILSKNVSSLESVLKRPELGHNFVDFEIIARKITGNITAESGEILPGVSIAIKGTTIGTVTDEKGHYFLSVTNEDAILVFSSIGYVTKEIRVGAKTEINVILATDHKAIDEVVVVGYGTQRKVNLTGAVETINVSDLGDRPLTNASAALQGKVAGAYITQQSGRPGFDNASILVRGVGTFNNTAPLIIIDGFEGTLNDVSPSDIESISILKDAASSSIYGNKASNGVVLVTTKRGKGNKVSVEYTGQYGIQSATTMPDVLSGLDYINLKNQAWNYSTGHDYTGYATDLKNFSSGTDNPLYPKDFSWAKYITQSAPITNQNIRITAGDDALRVSASLNYLSQDGILKGTEATKLNYRVNLSSKLYNNRLKFDMGLSGAIQKIKEYQQAEWGLYFAYINSPLIPPTLQAGATGPGSLAGYTENAWQLANSDAGGGHFSTNVPIDVKTKISYSLTKDLGVSVAYDYNRQSNSITDWSPIYNTYRYIVPNWTSSVDGNNGTAGLALTSNSYITQNFQTQVDYNHKFLNNNLEFKFLGGFQAQTYNYDRTIESRSNYSVNLPILSAGDPSTQKNNQYAEEGKWISTFGRMNFIYKDKYLLEGNLRYDGSSRFLKKYGLFPSVSFGWKINEEQFLKNVRQISVLKLRASWGLLGNENIGSYYASIDQLGLDKTYNLANSLQTAGYTSVLANRQTTWETSRQYDIGLDFGLFNNAFTGSIDYYEKSNSNILMQLPVSTTLGLTTVPYQNVAAMTNKGVELQLSFAHDFNKVKMKVTFAASHVKNEVTSLGGLDQVKFVDWTQSLVWKVGQPYNSYYGLVADGIYQNQGEINAQLKNNGVGTYFGQTAKPGMIKFKDLNGDGVIDVKDNTVIGKPFPDFTYSANLNFSWKNFDLALLLVGVSGVNTINQFAPTEPFVNGVGNVIAAYKNAWTEKNPSSTIQAVNTNDALNSIQSTYYMEDASYIRLKNVQLGYTFPARLLSNKVNRVRVYVSVQNALTLTNMRYGFDPEKPVASGQMAGLTTTGAPNSWISYFQARIFTCGLSLKF